LETPAEARMSDTIREAREEADMSQADLANKISRRRGTLSHIETGKADVDAGIRWLLAAYLKKPLSYFYPPYAREKLTPDEMGDFEHELLMHFIEIRGENLQKLVIQLVRVFAKYDPMTLYLELKPFTKERIQRAKSIDELNEKRRTK